MRFFYLEVKKIENLGFWGGNFPDGWTKQQKIYPAQVKNI